MRLDLTAEHTRYFTRDEKPRRLTGVTTYLGVYNKPQIVTWTGEQEREGVVAWLRDNPTKPLPTYTTKDGRVRPLLFADAKRDKAASLGTVTHARCEAWLLKDELEPVGIPEELFKQSLNGLVRFQEEWNKRGLTLIHSERVVIYDDGHMAYGGTADILARNPKGQVGLIDLKTSKASPWWPYDELFGQVAAYAEGSANDPKTALDVDWIEAWRIGTTPGDEIQTYPVNEKQRAYGWDLFRAAYCGTEAKRQLEKLRK